MPLTISLNSPGLLDVSVATDPITVAAGVTVDGAQLLGLGLLPLGFGIEATLPGASIDNAGTVSALGLLPLLGTAASAIALTAGGSVTVEVGGSVLGALDGVAVSAALGTVGNAGTISGAGGAGVRLAAGGTIGNTAGAVITGGTRGVGVTGTLSGAASTIGNLGQIGATAAGGIAASLDVGALTNGGMIASVGVSGIGATIGTGTAVNTVGGLIAGTLDGLNGTGAGITVTNAGAIAGTFGVGVGLALGGTVSNALGATIAGALDGIRVAGGSGTVTNLGAVAATGANGIGVNLLGGGVVIDAGTITGADATGQPGGIAVSLGGGGGSRLVLDPGAVLNGDAAASGVGNTLELAAGAGATIIRDIGATITGFGTTQIDSGAVAEILGAVTTPGTIAVGDGASLTLDGTVAAGVSVDLGGIGARLTLSDPGGFAGTIANLGTGDTIDLTGLGTGTTVAYDPARGGLTITTSGGVTSLIPITVAAGLGPVAVSLGGDGSGGVDITVGTGAGGAGGGGTVITTGPGGTTGTGSGGSGSGGTGSGSTMTGGTGAGGSSTSGSGTGNGDTGGTLATGPGAGTTITSGSGSGAAGGTTSGGIPEQDLVGGAAVAYGAGATQGDAISIDSTARFHRAGLFTIAGHVASGSGVDHIEISAVIDGGDSVDLGQASVAGDGSWTFDDRVGRHLQGFITATETDGAGGTLAVQAPYSLEAGFRDAPFVARQDLYTPDGSIDKATTDYHPGGSNDVHVHAAGQTFVSDFFDTYRNGGAPENTFVFDPDHGLDVIGGFRVDGVDHDTISLPSMDFSGMADLLHHTQNAAGGAVIHDPTTGDTLKLTGLTKAELKANPSDFSFHA